MVWSRTSVQAMDSFEQTKAYQDSQGIPFDEPESIFAADVYVGKRFRFFRGPDEELLEF